GLAEETGEVDAHDGRGHQAEVGERREAAADRRQAEEHVAEAIRLRDPVQLRSRIGDGDEAAADAVGADDLAGALEEVLLEDVRLEGAARLARVYGERRPQIDLPLDSLDLRGIGRVQHVQLRVARDLAEGHLEYLR